MKLTELAKLEFLGLVQEIVSDNPDLVEEIIKFAAAGIKGYANKQAGIRSDALAMLTDIVEQNAEFKTKYFPRKQILETLIGCYDNPDYVTKLKKEIEALDIASPDIPG